MSRILVVCTANICRSPATQAFLRGALHGYSVEIESAGTLAVGGIGPDSTIESLMLDRGYTEVSAHRSRVLLPSQLSRYELILCMERAHVEHIRRFNVMSVGKAMLLGHWDRDREVSDPVGMSREVYAASLDEMESYSHQWARKIVNMGMVA